MKNITFFILMFIKKKLSNKEIQLNIMFLIKFYICIKSVV